MATMTMAEREGAYAMHAALWIAQILLAIVFVMAGGAKLLSPMVDLMQNMTWTASMPEVAVRFIGFLEIAAAVGLIVPAATRIMPSLTVWAATGLVVGMVCAMIFHLMRGEPWLMLMPAVLGAIALFVVWGRTNRVVLT